ncbi:M28 family peptidase [Tellurirhabdus bombi]|uniref:M28 family peptidase n=1 Tax=Tellurirhabdus bombi TaxID=2907205 RepID=UPI001F192E9B|nr:M28 family peptidase [Tellurirhabdus bombi]
MLRPNPLIAFFTLLILIGLSVWSILLVRPIDALPETASATEFSAGRAMRHVRQIAKEPHAMGTAAHAVVRSYLVNQLRQLGLQTEIQDTTIASPNLNSAIGHVYNVVGRLKGKGAGKAILLMAHYDSQPNTPGAGDDASGVAAILETMRAIKQGGALQNDIVVLMTDGEEYGLYGASAFLRHPWAKDVGFVVNLEARGNSGPSMTFEISPENGWIVEEFAKVAPRPFASSVMYEVYRVLPNFTDFTVFRDAGYVGVNSAFIDGFVHYHKWTDNPDNLNQASLQHHGSNMLALTRHIGNLSLAQTKAPDKVFFNPVGSWLVQYPMSMNLLWVGLLTVLFGLTIVVGLKKEALTLWQTFNGMLLYVLILIVVPGVFFPINSLVMQLMPQSHLMNGVYGSNAFFVAYLLLATALFLLLVRLILRRLRLFSLQVGIYGLFFLITVVLFAFLPSSNYLTLFPLFFSLLGTLLIFSLDLHRKDPGVAYNVILILAACPAIFLLMPVTQLLSVTFALQLPTGTMAGLTLILGLLVPLLAVIDRSFRWKTVPVLPIILAVCGFFQTAWAIYGERPTPSRPVHSHVSYYLNTDTKQALWASLFTKTDDWNKQFFPSSSRGKLSEIYPTSSVLYLKNKAELIDLPAPMATLLNETATAEERQLTILLRSNRNAAHMELVLQPSSESDLLGATLNGEALPKKAIETAGGKVFYAILHGLPPTKEATLQVRLKPQKPLRLLLYDQTIGLPAQLVKVPPPAHVIPEQGRSSNLTVVRKEYSF